MKLPGKQLLPGCVFTHLEKRFSYYNLGGFLS